MKISTHDHIFPEETLQGLPLSYRHMAHLDTTGFAEHYDDFRFSKSALHGSKAYIGAGMYKPLHTIIVQDLFPKT